MSKWINKKAFSKFTTEKKTEKTTNGINRLDYVWKTPEKGTSETAKVYEGRFIPDKKGEFYKKYFYHMFRVGETWFYSLCPKTYNFDNYCPMCSVTTKLYTGTSSDKSTAGKIRRKEKFISNWFVVNDPRDADVDEERKVSGKVRLYEFPGKVETKLKEEIIDEKNGLGYRIFDPSEEGFNFILKVSSTKKDNLGRSWPDYSNSTFARIASPIGSDKEIDEYMKNTIVLEEYLDNQKPDFDRIKDSLKKLALWPLIENEWKRNIDITTEVKSSSVEKESQFEKNIEGEVKSEETTSDSAGEQTDEELLAELEGL